MVAIAVIEGCGGTPGAAGPQPVRIGALLPVSGYGLITYAAGFKAASRAINAHGGIKGRRVEVEICDSRNDPNVAQACARKLVTDGVVATAANVSPFSMLEGPILDEAGIPQIGSEAINPEDSTLGTAFPLEGGIFVQMAGGMIGMKRRGLRSMLMVTEDVPSGRTLTLLAGSLTKSADLELVGAQYIPPAAVDLTPYVQAAIQSRADVVFPGLPPAMTVPFLVASRASGAHYTIMLPQGEFTPQQISLMGGPSSMTENDIEFGAVPPLSATDRFPALRTFAADMDAELAAGDRDAVATSRSTGSLAAWLSVQIIARVAATLDTIDAAHLLAALRSSQSVDTLGLTAPWAPGHNGPLPNLPRVTNLFGYLATQHNGVTVLADPTPVNPFFFLRPGA